MQNPTIIRNGAYIATKEGTKWTVRSKKGKWLYDVSKASINSLPGLEPLAFVARSILPF